MQAKYKYPVELQSDKLWGFIIMINSIILLFQLFAGLRSLQNLL